jgi:hypothetical protein
MLFTLHRRKHIEHELTKIVRRALRNTAEALTTSAGTQFRSAVHESRKNLKKVQAVAAILREAGAKLPRKDRQRLKSAARALSTVRDSAAILDTFDRVHRRYPKQLPEHTYGILRRGLVAARDRAEVRAQHGVIAATTAKGLARARQSARTWRSPSIDWFDLTAIVAASYRRSRQAMQRASATGQSASLHDWRKQVKTLWYQLRLAAPLTRGVSPLVAALKRLETALGDDHNLVVLAATLRGCRDLRSMRADIRHIDRLSARMREPLRRRAFALGRRLHRRTPKAFTRWLRASSTRQRASQPVAA